MRHNGMKYICAAAMVGAGIGLAVTMSQANKSGFRGAKRCAKRAVSAVEDLMCSIKDMVM